MSTTSPPTHELHELLDRALFESERGEWGRALEYAERALALEPDHRVALKRCAIALWSLGRRGEGLAKMRRATEVAPEFESAHYNLACFYALLGRRDEMLGALRRAIALDPDYMRRAREDDDFRTFAEDEEFVDLTRPSAEATEDLRRVLAGDDPAAVADRLQKLGDEIPLTAVDWEDDALDGALARHAHALDTSVLRHVYRTIATLDVEPDEVDGWHTLHRVLRERDRGLFDELLLQCWRKRYADMDPGHLGSIDEVMLEHLQELPGEAKAALVLEAIRTHGPDALGDYRSLCASALADLGAEAPLARELVDAVDRILHGDSYVDADERTRRRKVLLSLPLAPLPVPEGSDDPWAWHRAALESEHPAHNLMAAEQLSIQRAPEARALLREHLWRVVELARDAELPDSMRVTAIEVIEQVGDADALEALVQALNARSPAVLFAIGRALRTRGVSFPAEPAASTLAGLLETADDWTREYDCVRALRWFPTPSATQLLLSRVDSGTREAIRREAIAGLGWHAPEEAIDALTAQLVEGSGQCVSAAAQALARYESPRARAVLRDEERYARVLSRAQAEARWLAAALQHFDVPSLPEDLFALFFGTKEFDAYEVLAAGLWAHPRETLLVDLVAAGLDTLRLKGRPGRHLVEIARAAVAAHPDGPSPGVRAALVDALRGAEERAIEALQASTDRDGKHATERASDPALAERQRRAYASRLQEALAPLGDAAAALPWSLLGVTPEPR